MAELIFQLAIIIGLAALISLIGRIIKQPPIIAYLLTGVIVGPLFLNLLTDSTFIQTFAHIGVALLLFIVGLNLDFRVFKEIGGVAALAGLGEIVIVALIGFLIALGLGFDYTPALYLAAALAFSSTVVVVKLLSDKKEIDTLHGRIALGILIVEDFVAAFVLMILPVLGTDSLAIIGLQIGKAVLLIAGVFIVSYIAFPRVLPLIARNQEILFLFSIAWALVIAVVFSYLGFSLEIGALLAGMALAQSKYSLEIGGKVKGVRDFFVVLFFVYFGAQLAGSITWGLVGQAVLFSAFILVGKPLIVMSLMRVFGYKKRTNFFTGVSLAQISEFSLILVLLGFTLGAVEQSLLSLVLLIALITIALSSYSTYYSHSIFNLVSRMLGIFDGKREIGRAKKDDVYDVVLFGCNRIGFNIMKELQDAKKKYIVVDYNPKTIIDLSREGINCVYGDANDLELLNDLNLGKAQMVISTIPELGTNLGILRAIGNKDVTFIPTSHYIPDTEALYLNGADYVLMPHFVGGTHTAELLDKTKFNKKSIQNYGTRQRKELRERQRLGQTHPENERSKR